MKSSQNKSNQLEIHQDNQTKQELENNSYDNLLNAKIKSSLCKH
jgi:hypothetical protein